MDDDDTPLDDDPRLSMIGMKFLDLGNVGQLRGLGLGAQVGNADALQKFGVGLAGLMPKAQLVRSALGPGFDALADGVSSRVSASMLAQIAPLAAEELHWTPRAPALEETQIELGVSLVDIRDELRGQDERRHQERGGSRRREWVRAAVIAVLSSVVSVGTTLLAQSALGG